MNRPPAEIATLARRHPDVPLIMAHLGGVGWRGVLDVKNCPNVLIDTSGAQPQAELVEFAIEQLDAERVIFGSDWPIRDLAVQRARIDGALVAVKARDAMLGGTMARLLKATEGSGGAVTVNAFDASAWVGSWVFGDGDDEPLDEIVRWLMAAGIHGAVFSPMHAMLAPEPMKANADLLGEIARRDVDGFDARMVPIINPPLPNWREYIAACLDERGNTIVAFKLIPNYHRYSLSDPATNKLANHLMSRGMPLCVQVRMLDERVHHPRMLVPGVPISEVDDLARSHPDLRILACGVYQSELRQLAEADNVSVELSSIESGDTLPNVLDILPPERVMLGTHAPVYYPAPAIAKVQGDGVSSETIAMIATGNAQRFFSVSP
ncbi:MAG: amidohydrolase family protein [Thermomicrobiales bacterium]